MAKNKHVKTAVVLAGIAAAGGGAAYYLSNRNGVPPGPPPAGVRSLGLSADTTVGVTNQEIRTTTTARDENNNPINNVPIYLFINNQSDGQIKGRTGLDGKLIIPIKFSQPGTYTVFVSDNQNGT